MTRFRIVLFCLGACSNEGSSPMEPGGPDAPDLPDDEEALDDVDLAMFAHVSMEGTLTRDQGAGIWDEAANGARFRTDDLPQYYVRRDDSGTAMRGYLVSFPDPPASAREVQHPALASLGPVYRYDDEVANIGGEIWDWSDVAGRFTQTFSYARTGDSVPTESWYFPFLAHETFHFYQLSAWQEPACWTQELEAYPMTRDNLALPLLEHKVLAAGLAAATTADKETALKTFISVRQARRALPEMRVGGVNLVDCQDEAQEQIEGTANYAENKIMEASGLAGTAEWSDTTVFLQLVFDPFADAAEARDIFAFVRFYPTGASLGMLLDDVGGVDWRSACKGGNTPSAWLTQKFPTLAPTELEALLTAAKQTHDYPALETRADEIRALP
jgi:hypothetical protein